MSKTIRQNVDTSSAEFQEGVEAGLNSTEDTRNWQAGNELGQELKNEQGKREPLYDSSSGKSSTPLFMKPDPEGNAGNLQDEKDEAEE